MESGTITLKDGCTASFNYFISPVTVNCGMRQLTSFNFRTHDPRAALDRWGQLTYTTGDALKEHFLEAAPAIISHITDSVRSALIVMSDRVFLRGVNNMYIGNIMYTMHLMHIIEANNIGSYTTSHSVRNVTYGVDEHIIKCMCWVPPNRERHIISKGVIAITPKIKKESRIISVYKNLCKEVLASMRVK